jgi:hypothetical protein
VEADDGSSHSSTHSSSDDSSSSSGSDTDWGSSSNDDDDDDDDDDAAASEAVAPVVALSLAQDADVLLEGEAWEVAYTDEGDPYYHQPFTQETRWELPEGVQRRVTQKIRKKFAEDKRAAVEAELQKARRKAKRQKKAFLAGEQKKGEELRLTAELIERVAAELLSAAEQEQEEAAEGEGGGGGRGQQQPHEKGQKKKKGKDEKALQPYYAYGGCKRCLVLAGAKKRHLF